ncbi:uncharacterized protein LOC131604470 [Vicia villosa]|uniref:uncharacterized protein LOC131604470 n=1 Tax=Vicia villosa TaxID=3911 RepID=UPI00273B765E|nr:uncharacterized protein LOC131604470 [Vicia villosa]
MDTDTFNFNEATITYTAFIQKYHDEANAVVSDEEHIAFLALWLSRTLIPILLVAVTRKRKIKEVPTQKASEVSKSNKPSGSDSITTDKKPTSSKPPTHSKRKASQIVVSDDDDKSPPRTRQAQKKRQKAVTPLGKEKGSGSSKITSPGEKVSSEESPLKGGSNVLLVESHNSSPDNIPTKDDVGTATSDLKAFSLTIDLDNLQDKSCALSPVVEDAQSLATIIPTMLVEESHSTDDSPPTHKSENMGADRQCSGSNNAAGHPTGSEDTVSEQDAMEETSKLATVGPHETSPFGTIVSPETTSTPAPVASHSSCWKAVTDATKKGDALKLKCSEKQKEYDECEQNIKFWKQEIIKLEEKIKEAESRKATIQQISEQELIEVAHLGIQHFEAAQKLE